MQSSRTNYPQESEQAVNQTIQLYMAASLTYDHLSAWSSNDDVNMPGFSKFFRYCEWRTWEQAQHLIDWQLMRGGRLNLTEFKPMIQVSELFQSNIEKAVQCAIEIEKKIEYQLRQLYTAARSKDDTATWEMVESKFLQLQLILIRCMVNHYNGLRQSQNSYHYDRSTMLKLIKRLDKFHATGKDSKKISEWDKAVGGVCNADKWGNWWPNHGEFNRLWTHVSIWY